MSNRQGAYKVQEEIPWLLIGIVLLGLVGIGFMIADSRSTKCIEWQVRCKDRVTNRYTFHPGVFYDELRAHQAAVSLSQITNQECEAYCSKEAGDDQPDRTVKP